MALKTSESEGHAIVIVMNLRAQEQMLQMQVSLVICAETMWCPNLLKMRISKHPIA